MGEDSDNHRGILDGGKDLQVAAAVWTVFNVDLEDGNPRAPSIMRRANETSKTSFSATHYLGRCSLALTT